MDLDPGYVELDPRPIVPPVFTDGLFESLAEPLVAVLGASDAVLDTQRGRIGDDAPDDPIGDQAGALDAAEAAHQAHAAGDLGSVADSLIGSGENVEGLRQSVLRYLPPPETNPDTTFVDPPVPPKVLRPPKGDWEPPPERGEP